MSPSAQLAQYLIVGLTIGCTYALLAIGFNIIFNATGIINLAQGEFVMLGGMSMIALSKLHIPLLAAFVLAVLLVGIVGALFQRLAVYPLRNEGMAVLVFVTLGVSILLSGSAMFLWGKQTYKMPAMVRSDSLSVFGAALHPQYLIVIGVTLLIVICLTLFFDKTIMGQAIKACSINRLAASLVGISYQKMVLLSFVLSAAVAAIAGILITPITMMEYDRGPMLCLKGFAAATLGGFGSSVGAVAGGIAIGMLESFGAGYISSSYKDALPLIVLLLVLFWKPSGLFGTVEEREI